LRGTGKTPMDLGCLAGELLVDTAAATKSAQPRQSGDRWPLGPATRATSSAAGIAEYEVDQVSLDLGDIVELRQQRTATAAVRRVAGSTNRHGIDRRSGLMAQVGITVRGGPDSIW
jgi:hypothetical protein